MIDGQTSHSSVKLTADGMATVREIAWSFISVNLTNPCITSIDIENHFSEDQISERVLEVVSR